MRVRRSPLAPVVAAGAVAVALVVTLLVVTRGVQATVMVIAVAGLAGMYMLRRYARARLLYDRGGEPRRPGRGA